MRSREPASDENPKPLVRTALKVHVLLCYSLYPPIQAGGAELIVSYLAEGLAKRGHQVTVVSTCGPDMEPYPTQYLNGVEVIRFFPQNRYWLFKRESRSGFDRLRWHLRDAWNRAAGRRLRDILRQKRPDVVHNHGVEGFSPTIWRSARSLGIPLVYTAHDYYLICPRALLLTRGLKLCTSPQLACRVRRAWYLRCADAIDLFCSPSQFLLDRHLAAGLHARHCAVVLNGIPTARRAARPNDETPDRVLRLVFAGRLTREKGVLVALQAMRRLPSELPVQLTIAGKGMLEAEVVAAAKADSRITFAGFVSGEQKSQLFDNAHCLLLPSLWYENAPVVILEAAGHGLAVIGSRLGAIPEFVQDGVNGSLFEAGNPQALADVIASLASDRAQVKQLGLGGAPLIARHSIDQMVDAYLTHYAELVPNQDSCRGTRSMVR